MTTKKQQEGFAMCLRTAARMGWAFMLTPVELEDGTTIHVRVHFSRATQKGEDGLHRTPPHGPLS